MLKIATIIFSVISSFFFQIFLMGCRQLTEKALYYLLSSLKNLIHVDMTGTDVGIIPVDVPGTL